LFGAALVVTALAANMVVSSRQLNAKTVDLMGVMQDPDDEGGHAACVICEACSGGHVSAGASAGSRHGNSHPSVCGLGTCNEFHPTGCTGEGPGNNNLDLATSWNAAVTKKYAVIRKMLKEHPKALVLNEKRLALQWMKCDGKVGASLPLPPETVAYLSH
jgi:hypothetical protein